MKLAQKTTLIEKGSFAGSAELKKIMSHITEAVKAVEWPEGSGSFTIYPQSGKKSGEGNGVTPIKNAFISKLKSLGWTAEDRKINLGATGNRPGPIDATYPVGNAHFAVEWETGNISSSHRALNKMVLGLLSGKLVGGVLVLPTKDMKKYLTDRVGNYPELEPYFPLWSTLKVENGVLYVISVEQDAESMDVPRIRKGTDGRAAR